MVNYLSQYYITAMDTNYTIGPAVALVLPDPINNVSPILVHYAMYAFLLIEF